MEIMIYIHLAILIIAIAISTFQYRRKFDYFNEMAEDDGFSVGWYWRALFILSFIALELAFWAYYLIFITIVNHE